MAVAAKRTARKRPAGGFAGRWLGLLGLLSVSGAVLAAAAFGYHYLSQPGRLPLRVVEVGGALERLDRDEIQRTVVDAIDGGFFSCDMRKLRQAVVAMPWVADVSIRRVWPDRLHMLVTEQVPLARWGDDALVSIDAGVFRPSKMTEFDGLVQLQGPAGSEQRVVQFFRVVLTAARARGLHIEAVRLDERRHWWLHFNRDLTVSLGRENVDHRLAQFFRVYPSLATQSARQPARVDMRYEHGFAVRWHEPAGQDPAAGREKSQEKV
jgi:cell division protein FtsQ